MSVSSESEIIETYNSKVNKSSKPGLNYQILQELPVFQILRGHFAHGVAKHDP